MSTGQVHRGREGAAVESHGEDLLSVLPDEILLHIRSMLPAEAVARTRFLSRRWAKLPLHSTPPASSLLQQAWRGGGGARGGGVLDLEEGWRDVLAGVAKLKSIHTDSDFGGFSPDEYMHIYTLVYYMCTQKGHKDYPKELYHLCKQALDDHLDSIVLPSLNEKHGNFLLAEMLQSWEKHKLMVRWLRRFFDYLDRVSITWKSLHSLEHMGWIGFRDMVFDKLKSTLTTTVIGMINDERNGLLIDRALLKNVIHMCNEFRDSQLNSYPEYILKAEECLQKEKEQVYSHSTTEPKDTSDKGMALVKHGTDTAKSRKNKKNEVMVGFPINLISGSRVVDEILGRVPVKAPFTDSTFEFGTSSCNPPDSFGYIPTTSKSFAERLMAPENEDLVVMLSLDLAEELETIDEVYQQISRKGERGSSKLWKFIDHGVKKCTQIRRSITLLGGSPQEIPNYLIR
ncbi:putative cullin-like protein 2 [Oryza glaberrima]|uniref:Cullin N-terminal domain-containing protein n=1 Tax=Oryza glaberrima TaxID=4538 RepID=I1PT49_ORYGL|nr:putative cullin-like protein 2 [Oryza glaberrima]